MQRYIQGHLLQVLLQSPCGLIHNIHDTGAECEKHLLKIHSLTAATDKKPPS